MWGWLTSGCWCCGSGGFAPSFLSLFVFLGVNVVSTLSSGYVRAPLPYRLVNAGLFDYKKKKIKKFQYKVNLIVNTLLILQVTFVHHWHLLPIMNSKFLTLFGTNYYLTYIKYVLLDLA